MDEQTSVELVDSVNAIHARLCDITEELNDLRTVVEKGFNEHNRILRIIAESINEYVVNH